jgi:trans-aconitate 2-methyltransferase
MQVYGHLLPSRVDVVEWVKGTLLTEARSLLPEGLYEPFVAQYRAELMRELPDEKPYFYAFKRVLLWAER